MAIMRIIAGLMSVLAAFTVLPALAAPLTLSGEVTYRERIALPPNAVLSVQLLDLTDAAAKTPVRAEAAIASKGQVPLTFTLNFDDKVLLAGHAYALSAEISAGGQVVFRNAEPYPIDPRAPAGPILILVQRAADPAPAPVVPATPALLDIVWRAETLNGAPVIEFSELTLSIASDMRAGGKGSCNNYFAQARLEEESLRFSAVAATRMACAEPVNAQEAAFFAALAATATWRIEGELLLLLDAQGTTLVSFNKTAG